MTETNDIHQTLQQQTELLQHIASSQQELLAVEKQRLNTERLQMFTSWAKIIVIVLITWIGFVAAQKMITTLSSSMNGMLGGNVELNGANDLATQLKGSQELMRELLGS